MFNKVDISDKINEFEPCNMKSVLIIMESRTKRYGQGYKNALIFLPPRMPIFNPVPVCKQLNIIKYKGGQTLKESEGIFT